MNQAQVLTAGLKMQEPVLTIPNQVFPSTIIVIPYSYTIENILGKEIIQTVNLIIVNELFMNKQSIHIFF